MPWVVAEFLPHRSYSDTTVQTIPAGWLRKVGGSLVALYPPERTSLCEVREMIIKGVDPADGWDLLPLKYSSKHYDDFISATSVEMSAVMCEENDLESYFQMLECGKRYRKARHMCEPGEECARCRGNDFKEEFNADDPLKLPVAAAAPKSPIRVSSFGVSKPITVTVTQRKGVGVTSPRTYPGTSGLRRIHPGKPVSLMQTASKMTGSSEGGEPSNMIPLFLSKTPRVLQVSSVAHSATGPLLRVKEPSGSSVLKPVLLPAGWKKAPASVVPSAKVKVIPCSSRLVSLGTTPSIGMTTAGATGILTSVPAGTSKAGGKAPRGIEEQLPKSATAPSSPLRDPLATMDMTELKEYIDAKFQAQEERLAKLEREIAAQRSDISGHITEKLDSLMQMIMGLDVSRPPTEEQGIGLETLHSLPIESFDDMGEFEFSIASHPTYKNFMIRYLGDRSTNLLCRGGLSERMYTAAVNKTVYDIMAMIMTNELARGMCLKKKTTHKLCMEERYPRIIELVFDTVKRKAVNGLPVDMVTVKRSMGEWLRQSRLRAVGDVQVYIEEIEEEDC